MAANAVSQDHGDGQVVLPSMCFRAAIGAPFPGKSLHARFVRPRGWPMQWHVVAITTRRVPHVMHEQLSAGPPSCAPGQARDGVSPALNQSPVTCVLTQSPFSPSWFKTTVVCVAELLGAPPAPFFFPISLFAYRSARISGLSRTARGGVSQGAIWPNAVDLQYGMHGPGWHSGPSVILG